MDPQTSHRQAIDAALQPYGLRVMGGLNPPDGPHGTVFLVGPDGRRFWDVFKQSPERADGATDPVDRWSLRVLNGIAAGFGAEAIFPFGGPPYHPFIGWAHQSGECFQSPVQILVHADAGLFVSYRGALAFSEKFEIPAPRPNPCDSCIEKPCLTSCPANALVKDNYNVAACKVFLDTENGQSCMTRGCAVRRACPVGQSDRTETQSAYHMSYFHRKAPS